MQRLVEGEWMPVSFPSCPHPLNFPQVCMVPSQGRTVLPECFQDFCWAESGSTIGCQQGFREVSCPPPPSLCLESGIRPWNQGAFLRFFRGVGGEAGTWAQSPVLEALLKGTFGNKELKLL